MGSETVRMIDCEDNITGQKQQSANTAHGLLSGQHHRTETAVSVHGPRSPVRTTSPDRNSSQRTRPRSPVRTTSPDRNSSQRTRPTVSCQDNITGQKQQSAYTAHGLLSGQHHRTLPTVSCQDNITGQKQQSAYTAHGLLSGHHRTETAVSVHGPRSPVRTTSPGRNSSQRTRPTVSCQDITGQKT